MSKDQFYSIGDSITNNKNLTALAAKLVIASVLIEGLCTLFPFDFSFEGSLRPSILFTALNHFDDGFNWLNLLEVFGNGFVFLLFGFGLACYLYFRGLKIIMLWCWALIGAFTISLFLEILQIFLPSRNPSVTDVLVSVLGAGTGVFVFDRFRSQIISTVSTWFEGSNFRALRRITVLLLGYLLFIFIIIIGRPGGADLINWDVNFPLIVGNEKTGDRPWEGYISNLTISQKFATKEIVSKVFADNSRLFELMPHDVVAFYKLGGQGDYFDQTGNLPALSWQGTPRNDDGSDKVLIDSEQWLETTSPVIFLSKQIRKTSQFTLDTTVSSMDMHQTGPARIISLSGNLHKRNFTLGQSKEDLIFRFRTPINGDNGARYELVFPDVFSNQKKHHLVITYAESTLWVYVDSLNNIQVLKIPLFLNRYQIIDYILVCIPLGILLITIPYLLKEKTDLKIVVVRLITLSPCILLEVILANKYERGIELKNLLLSLLVILSAFLLFRFHKFERV